ncbi:MAG: three-Cys-motif partner protein TcmP [Saprospiraceae bacterium]|nr:three-Cys-motif partner protein TcmP [Saprospiraceae bacterium]MCF8249134.1 three-Cys-motif partner protein TcmP [Saprospiraceae bacterium]MCF8281391.1 three-Cys-motif partner protein TcmP [Bacteroidales bacterium]MCF8311156.1 three-Cys-motif partner protein TcmP [Saprospiraceae bacterium]MCF8440246.1 three-Cys-motif partner protein TcmP [Saprospiraceae bacterium]
MNNVVNEPSSEWGGYWTERKLEAFIKYVKAYLSIMKKQPQWKLIYFDGFAGSGERRAKKEEDSLLASFNLFEHIGEEEENLYQGAAERVIRLSEPDIFDFYYFVEKYEKNIEKLKNKLSTAAPDKSSKLQFKPGDCNKWLQELASAMKRKPNDYASLIFIDPFGMQVDWNSIEQLKGTRSDVWILIPTGVIVNRLLDRKGELKFIKKLESFFGLNESEIREIFYRESKVQSLFDVEEQTTVTKISDPISRIADIYIEKMSKVWKFVTKPALRLDNTRGLPIFHFVFASNNANAHKIAKQIIQKV